MHINVIRNVEINCVLRNQNFYKHGFVLQFPFVNAIVSMIRVIINPRQTQTMVRTSVALFMKAIIGYFLWFCFWFSIFSIFSSYSIERSFYYSSSTLFPSFLPDNMWNTWLSNLLPNRSMSPLLSSTACYCYGIWMNLDWNNNESPNWSIMNIDTQWNSRIKGVWISI